MRKPNSGFILNILSILLNALPLNHSRLMRLLVGVV